MVTDEMMKRAIEAYAKDTGAEGFQLEGWIEPAIRAALEAALSAAEPVGYVSYLDFGSSSTIYKSAFAKGQNCIALFDRPQQPAPSVAVMAKPDGYLTPTMPGESWHSWKSCAISEPGARPFYFSPAIANTEWKELNDAFSNFINCYGDPFKPKRNHEKETERNVKALSEAFDAARSALSGSRQSAQAVAVKALKWDEFSTELKRHFQSNTILGQYQIAYLGEFECWQLYSPQKSSTWKENFSRHKSSDEAKAAAQADFEARILSALSAQVQDVAGSGGMEFPEALTDDLRDVLSTMIWTSGQIAACLRAGGDQIKTRAEDEQAHVLHWLISLALKHGPEWRAKASERIKAIRDAAAPAKQEGK